MASGHESDTAPSSEPAVREAGHRVKAGAVRYLSGVHRHCSRMFPERSEEPFPVLSILFFRIFSGNSPYPAIAMTSERFTFRGGTGIQGKPGETNIY